MTFISFVKVQFRRFKVHLLASVLLVFLFYSLFLNSSHGELLLSNLINIKDQSKDENEPPQQFSSNPIQKTDDISEFVALGEDSGGSRMEKDYEPYDQPPVKSLPRSFHFPPPENIYKLPKIDYSSKEYHQIQTNHFEDGTGKGDDAKLQEITKVFLKSWNSYKKHAIEYDELLPLSHKGKNPFVGWSITLLDTLDTLHLMGLKDEFTIAVNHVSKIDFKKSMRDYIPTFETVIRAFGGLISGYELSEDPILLEKTIEIGEMLVGIFDTPNNLPLLYYRWADVDTEKKKFASIHGSVAEFGTLLLEFTRFAQITQNDTYFHFVHKLTKDLEEYINEEKKQYPDFPLNGLLPTHLDISGCIPIDYSEEYYDPKKHVKTINRDNKFLCESVGIKASKFSSLTYTLGGLADSYYEYLIKQYHLLNGSIKDYLNLFDKSIKVMKNLMLFKAKLPSILLSESNTVPHLKTDPDDVLFLSEFKLKERGQEIKEKTWATHLSCFAGGMFGLSSRINNNLEDLEIGKKLTNGCYKLYELMELMPEWSILEACPEGKNEDDEECKFDLKDKIERIRLKNEKLDKNHFKDKDLLEDLSKHEGFNNRVDNKIEDMNQESDTENDLDSSQLLYRMLNVNEKNYEQYLQGKDGHKFSLDSLKKFPPKPKPKFKKPFKIVESDLPNESLSYDQKSGNVYWNVGRSNNLPLYFNNMDPKFILRPELIESFFYMYRITGDLEWREKAWKMFKNTVKHTGLPDGAAALVDVSSLYLSNGKVNKFNKKDSCESFWFAETLKYYYLLYSDKDLWSLDEWVFNTEAHPFRRSNPGKLNSSKKKD